MKNKLHMLCAVLLATLALSGAAVTPSAAQSCLGKRDIQNAISAGQIQPLASILAMAGVDSSEEVLSVQVCDQGGQLYYMLAVLDASGDAQNLVLNARDGSR